MRITAEGVKHDKRKSVSLFPHPGFISKTQLCARGTRSLQKLVIPTLLPRLGPDMSEDCFLCPVRGLKVYLAKTEDQHKNTLSGWLRKLIHHIYKTIEGEVLPLANARAHEVHTCQLLRLSVAAWTCKISVSLLMGIPLDLHRFLP